MNETVHGRVETHWRSMAKAVSYRIVGSTATSLVAWFVTGSLWTGLSIGLVDSLIKVVCFYFHERAWHRVKWGLAKIETADGQGGGI